MPNFYMDVKPTIKTTYQQTSLSSANNTVHEYNSQYHKTKTLLPENQTIGFTPNAFGDVLIQDNPGSNDITRTYDLRRRLKTETNGAGESTTYEYDLNNNRTAVIKPEGNRWEYDFDAANRLTALKNIPESITTTYSYDAADNLTSITDAEQKVTTFTFDDRNRKKSKTYPDGVDVINYDYDANGNLEQVTYPNGVITTNSFDALNRLYQLTYTGTYGDASVLMTLDGNGNVEHIAETIEGNSYTHTMNYDDLDRLENKTDRYGNTFLYTYDANGNRKQFRDHDNKVTTYNYDDLNRLEQLTQAGLGAFTWEYNAAGLPKTLDYPNGSAANYEYDNANRIALIDNKQSGVTVSSHAYEYDLNGNRDKLTESNIDASQITTYEYDDADRLMKTNYPSYISTLTLDKVGNRELEVISRAGEDDNEIDYSYNNRDQLTGFSDTEGNISTYDFDSAGNQTLVTKNGVSTILDYSPRQRVKSITVGMEPEINYSYDPNGFRVEKTTNGQTVQYLYDDQALTAETNTLGNTIARYHYSNKELIAETRNGQNTYQLNDAMGTTVAMTNQDGSVQVRYNYDVWGNRNNQTGSSDSPFGFTGYQLDETGLYYAQQRYYDPTTARFNREDPLQGNPQKPPSLHRYLYANANPTVYIDPDGRESLEQLSYFEHFQRMLGFGDDTNSDEREIRMEIERMRVNEEGLPKSTRKRKENFNLFDMMNSIEKSKNSELLRVAESSTNEMLLEMNISKVEVVKRAHLSSCVYNPECTLIDKSIGNITRLTGDDLKPFEIEEKELTGNWSGFKSSIFKDHDTNEIIFAFAGTDDLLGDMYNNIAQGAGISSYQYDKARELAVRAAAGAKRQGQNISFTGHSLGGGLASFASMITGKKGTTFNAAGLNIITALKGLYTENLITDEGNIAGNRAAFQDYIDAFYVQGEVLNRSQDFIPLILPDAVGRRIELQRGSTNWSPLQHGIGNVCRALGKLVREKLVRETSQGHAFGEN